MHIFQFQFHFGTIKGIYKDEIKSDFEKHFNSTLVRLKANRSDVQIQYVHDFNSTLVRLKAVLTGKLTLYIVLISIPLWYD